MSYRAERRKVLREADSFRNRCISFARKLRNGGATDQQILRLLMRDMNLEYKLAMEVIGEISK